MGRRKPTTPDNHSVEVVPVFTPDPHGAAMFAGIVNGTLGELGSRVVMDTRGSGKWHGWAQDPQGRMTGAANLGAARPAVDPVTRFDQSQAPAPDSVQQLFAERMTERRYG